MGHRTIAVCILCLLLATTLLGCGQNTTPITAKTVFDGDFDFTGANPPQVKVGERIPVYFNFANKGLSPVLALNVRFLNLPVGSKVIPAEDWGVMEFAPQVGTLLTSTTINLKRNTSLGCRFEMSFDLPGVYQIQLQPMVLTDAWKISGTYILNIVVEDTPEAQANRWQQLDRLQKQGLVAELSAKINKNDFERDSLSAEISDLNRRIEGEKAALAGQENERARVAALKTSQKGSNGAASTDYDVDTKSYEQDSKNTRDRIVQWQQTVTKDQRRLQELAVEKEGLVKQRKVLEPGQ
ncbi:MAG: hypothetical protein P4N59_17130 [Negativicutes bacterium]|nr:hypothetical protein [Negativicutes bacterium]